jgi:hypothetical protein
LKQQKKCFDAECLGSLDQKKQAKIKWLQGQNQSNVDNLNNLKRGASRHFRIKNKEYLKARIVELETNSNIKKSHFCRGISKFKKGYQPRTNIVEDGKGDLVTKSHRIFARWRKHFSHLFNIGI